MHRITIQYGKPTDAAAFDSHYFDVHVPIAHGLPGLKRFTWSKPRPMGKGPDIYFVAELWFDSADDMKAAIKSSEMAAAGADLANFSVASVTMSSGEVNEVQLS